ncbi:hypothetical protein PUF88_00965 [Lactobacillaceae bacterium L1_55_11]|nr:hypothetical protein [Lactobacillaceae bacterium L1_55_11]
MKKIITSVVAVAALAVASVAGYAQFNHQDSSHAKVTKTSAKSSTSVDKSEVTTSPSSSSSSSSSSAAAQSSAVNPQGATNYDPNKTAGGIEITMPMIEQARQELDKAGIPADNFAPSDIKTIIANASQQGVSIVEYAKQNFHSN